MSNDLVQALNDIEKERGIPKRALIEAIKSALSTAYKKNFGIAQNVSVEFNEINGEVKVFSQKKISDEVKDPRLEMSLEEAQELYPDCKVEDLVYVEATPSDFGRIAAQTAKQVVIQKLREAERSLIYEEFLEREGEIITGTIQRLESKTVYISLGRTEGIMMASDQIFGERYEVGQRIKAYIYEVKNTSKGPNIFVSRSHPYFLRRLFEMEVPEIYDGVVEIKSIAREAGARSKIAVYSLDDKIDSVGACVGPRGLRVQNIVSELGGEKIDIIKYDKDPERYISNALSPSRVVAVNINETDKIARVIVPDYQLSLAIGKEGQNARLAAKLTGWKVDIRSESQMSDYYNEIDAEMDDEVLEQDWAEENTGETKIDEQDS
ncbi:transcription termination factor NusA [Syntrophomonas wolfei]|uniref:Transcription termination/antitermination protein NusA n=1 Tax=Syntrophomonas wolfei subsp. wolfei (strain DSM 2245B / Goettingen) TaxID=335541 RepID=Q0AYJ0_SYNWW|nr:transcription termination factor NusA [Syntrophomonas wolfei]ABI68214.1 NusA antitermination factor [Syntrophomonas wolfei subsp. wolfei str. Goettingen G311]